MSAVRSDQIKAILIRHLVMLINRSIQLSWKNHSQFISSESRRSFSSWKQHAFLSKCFSRYI